MTIDKLSYWDGGAYSDVFAIEGYAYKIFLAQAGGGRVTEDVARRTFEMEVRAYRQVTNKPAAAKFIPQFAGTPIIRRVLDGEIDISTRYFLDCCIKVEFIRAPFPKLADIKHRVIALEAIQNAFSGLDCCSLSDASVCFPDDPARTKVIDFALSSTELPPAKV